MGTGALLRAVFRLEGERTLALCRLGREPGAEAALEDVEARLTPALAALEALGVAYPAHDVARRYKFSDADYLVLQLALLPWQGLAAVQQATALLGDPGSEIRVSHVIALVLPGHDDWESARNALASLRVLDEGIITLSTRSDGDPAVVLSLSVRELLGLE
ncbi:MAG: hypothetical protein CVU56_02825 [Deltaproteobacteria bacterium HGW-Deltaproteobacteria-14]|jgi:hypothetical protein|nr:MAG: hypothetical protein CVU56_02825 [Deltaproteobacteria bacterium HGW-Deltaproteobacteria-14]